MNISIKKDVLLENINIVIKAVTTRSTLRILECILIVAYYDGIKLMANDLEISIVTDTIPADVLETGSVALESKIFADIIRRLPGEDVTITADNKNLTNITSGKSEFTILGFPGNEFPLQPQVDKDSVFSIKAGDLKNMIRQTIFSVSTDESKPALTGELFQIKDDYLNIVSVDGYRVSFRKKPVEANSGEMRLIVPAKALGELVRILPGSDVPGDNNTINIYFTDRHILFEMEGSTLVSRLLEGDFYKYELIFSDDYISLVTLDRQQFLSGLERVSLIATKEIKKNPIKVEISNETLVISSNAEVGKARDEIAVVAEGEDLAIAFNPRYVIDVLRAIDEEIITMQFKSALSPCIIKPLGNKDANYLVLPLKLQN